MIKQIFINLPVKDLKKSIAFFTKLGFTFNPQFTDENATCMIIGENIFAMLITEQEFTRFTKKKISDAHHSTEIITAMATTDRASVDLIAQRAVEGGGKLHRDTDDYGWMYAKSFEDLDGHIWEICYIDEGAAPKKP